MASRPAKFGPEASNEEVVADLLHRIQLFVMPRRIRVREFFNDFDPLRCGRCTHANFARALAMIGVGITESEIDVLAEHFTDYGPKVQRPQVVCWQAFCAKVDEVFASEEVQEGLKAFMMTGSPGSTIRSTFVPNSIEEEDQFSHVMHRVATLCKAMGVDIKHIYTEFDRTLIPNPSMQNPRRTGKVTKEQFRRRWPFKKEMSPDDLELIIEKYSTKSGDVHFLALHNEVTEVMEDPAQPFPTSPLYLRPDDTEWSHASIPIVERITAKVVEKRARLREFFYDFDPLRKGFCTPGQVKTVFTIVNLSKEVDKYDFETLLTIYLADDGLFCYRAFCEDVERAFTTPGLERDPLAMIDLPDATTTMCARRNPMRLQQAKLAKIGKIQDKIQTFVRKRRVEMRPIFKDFDRANRGYITRSQFERIMATMNLDLDEKAVGLMCAAYCDFGNHMDFNYIRFLKDMDPPAENVELAMTQMTSPHIPFKPKEYFDSRGRVMAKSMSLPML